MKIRTTTRAQRLLAVLVATSLIAVVFAGCAGPGGADGIDLNLRTEDPEQFLESALELSGMQMDASDLFAGFSDFDLSRFGGRPTEHSFSFTIDQLDPTVAPIAGANIDMSLLIDEAAGNYLIEFDIDAGILSFAGNRIFISPDLLALSAPSLYTRHQYLTINPNTLVEDWNASDFGAAFGELDPADLDELQAALAMLEGAGGMMDFQGMVGLMEAYTERMEQLEEQLMAASEFLDEGDVEITVGETTHNAARLGYYIPAQALDVFTGEFSELFIEMFSDLMDNFIGAMAMADPTLSADMIRQEMLMVFDNMSFSSPQGMTIYYYIDIDTGRLLRSHIPDWTSVVGDGFGSEAEMRLDVLTYYLGEQNAIDITHTTFTISDGTGNVIEGELRMYIPEGGPYVFYMQMDLGIEGVLTFEMGYDPTGEQGSFWIEIDAADRFMQFDLEIRGDVVNTPEEFALRDGRMTSSLNGDTVLAASFEYSLRNAAPEDVDIDRSEAASLFDIDLAELERDLMPIFMMMGMM